MVVQELGNARPSLLDTVLPQIEFICIYNRCVKYVNLLVTFILSHVKVR